MIDQEFMEGMFYNYYQQLAIRKYIILHKKNIMILGQRTFNNPYKFAPNHVSYQHTQPSVHANQVKQQDKLTPSKQQIEVLEYALLLNNTELEKQTLTSRLFHCNPGDQSCLFTFIPGLRKSKVTIKALCPNAFIQKVRILYFMLLTQAYDPFNEDGFEISTAKAASPTSTLHTSKGQYLSSSNDCYMENYQKQRKFKTPLNILRVNFYKDSSVKTWKQKYLAEFFQFLEYDLENLKKGQGNQQKKEKQNIVIGLMNKYPIMDQIFIDMIILFIEKNCQSKGVLNIDDNYNIKLFVEEILGLKIEFTSNWDFKMEGISVHIGIDVFTLDFNINSYVDEIVETLEEIGQMRGLDVSNVGGFNHDVFMNLDKSYINDLKEVLTNSICSQKSLDGFPYAEIVRSNDLKQSREIHDPIIIKSQNSSQNIYNSQQVQRPISYMGKGSAIPVFDSTKQVSPPKFQTQKKLDLEKYYQKQENNQRFFGNAHIIQKISKQKQENSLSFLRSVEPVRKEQKSSQTITKLQQQAIAKQTKVVQPKVTVINLSTRPSSQLNQRNEATEMPSKIQRTVSSQKQSGASKQSLTKASVQTKSNANLQRQAEIPLTSRPIYLQTSIPIHFRQISDEETKLAPINLLKNSISQQIKPRFSINQNYVYATRPNLNGNQRTDQNISKTNIICKQKSFSLNYNYSPSSASFAMPIYPRFQYVSQNDRAEDQKLNTLDRSKSSNEYPTNIIRDTNSEQRPPPQNHGKFQQIRMKIVDKSTDKNVNQSSREIKKDSTSSQMAIRESQKSISIPSLTFIAENHKTSGYQPMKGSYQKEEQCRQRKVQKSEKSFNEVEKDIGMIIQNIKQDTKKVENFGEIPVEIKTQGQIMWERHKLQAGQDRANPLKESLNKQKSVIQASKSILFAASPNTSINIVHNANFTQPPAYSNRTYIHKSPSDRSNQFHFQYSDKNQTNFSKNHQLQSSVDKSKINSKVNIENIGNSSTHRVVTEPYKEQMNKNAYNIQQQPVPVAFTANSSQTKMRSKQSYMPFRPKIQSTSGNQVIVNYPNYQQYANKQPYQVLTPIEEKKFQFQPGQIPDYKRMGSYSQLNNMSFVRN